MPALSFTYDNPERRNSFPPRSLLCQKEQMMKHSGHGIVKDKQGQEQPADKKRAQTAHQSDPNRSTSHEGTRDPALSDAEKTSGSGTRPHKPRG
jgi:hypothetical protein